MTTTRPNRRRRAGGALATALLAAAALTACHTGTDDTPTAPITTATATPTTTTTPTPTATLSAKDQNIADAKAGYKSFVELSDKVGQAKMKGWGAILTHVGSADLRSELTNFYTQASQQRLRQTGSQKISSWTVTKYVSDPTGSGHEQVHMDVCIDNGALDILNTKGKSVLQPGYIQQQILTVEMQRQTDGRWTVNKNTATGTAC